MAGSLRSQSLSDAGSGELGFPFIPEGSGYDSELLFLRDGKLIEQDSIDRTGFDIDPIIRPGTILFETNQETAKGTAYTLITKESPLVSVKKNKLSDGFCYTLTPIDKR